METSNTHIRIDVNSFEAKATRYYDFATLRISNDSDTISFTMYFDSVNDIEKFVNSLDAELAKFENLKMDEH